jgi:hypothetical protein
MEPDLRPHYRLVIQIVLAVALLTPHQLDAAPQAAQNWWTLNTERDIAEKGRLRELLNKRNVYISVSFSDTGPNSQTNTSDQNNMSRVVHEAIAAHKELRKVTYPEEAEFAIIVRASMIQGAGDRGPNFSLLLETEAEVSLEVLVLVPGERQYDGTRIPRIVWEHSSPNTQLEAAAAARFTVDGFLWELRKLRLRK